MTLALPVIGTPGQALDTAPRSSDMVALRPSLAIASRFRAGSDIHAKSKICAHVLVRTELPATCLLGGSAKRLPGRLGELGDAVFWPAGWAGRLQCRRVVRAGRDDRGGTLRQVWRAASGGSVSGGSVHDARSDCYGGAPGSHLVAPRLAGCSAGGDFCITIHPAMSRQEHVG